MSYEAAVAAIKKHFAEQWADRTPVAYDDVAFSIPSDAAWLRLTIQHGMGYQASVGSPGSNQFRREGLVTVQIFTPEGGGAIAAYELADAVTPIFQRLGRVDGIAFKDVRLNEVGNRSAGWYHVNIKAEFEYDTIA